jgi:transposase
MDAELISIQSIQTRFEVLQDFLDERLRRLFAASEAKSIGYGGISLVARATGVSRRAITLGCKELEEGPVAVTGRIRRPGGGRKRATDKYPELGEQLERLIEPTTRGDPESPLRWTCKSVRKLSEELKTKKCNVSHNLVAEVLREMGYSLQANQKTIEGASHPDRNAQFEHINQTVRSFQRRAQPVISVDTKKKELVGDFKNAGREWRRKKDPTKVRVNDFPIPGFGKVAPYGVYDVTENVGWVSVGIDHDTAAFAVQSIRKWWQLMGCETYPDAKQLYINADGGGSNGSRVRLWKLEVQKLATETGLKISISHLPPGTSKWNKIEHRLFSFISQNWRGKPLVSHEVIVNLISATRTNEGLCVECGLDTNEYPKGIKVSDEQMDQLNLEKDSFHGDWNYTILPK